MQRPCYGADTALLQLLQATKLPGVWRPLLIETSSVGSMDVPLLVYFKAC